ncbi:hypothetical protein BVRB_5g102320 [Beta vulgaris subsp. vulgaris]|nr:hypothetical protein BVRB_5g102320 [Beta vulgaris subsp. vulgaris]
MQRAPSARLIVRPHAPVLVGYRVNRYKKTETEAFRPTAPGRSPGAGHETPPERGESKSPNQIFFEIVGGRKKGWVPGLGTSADLYFERSSRGGGSSSSSCTPSMLSQLSARFEEEKAEMQRERERMQKEIEEERIARQKEREEDRRVQDEYLAQMRATMETYSQMMSQCGGSFRFIGPPDPPTGGGDACAT